MEGPAEQKKKFYVYGFWHIGEVNNIVTKNGKNDIHEFDEIQDALDFIKKESLSNINVTWCLTWDGWYVEHNLKKQK